MGNYFAGSSIAWSSYALQALESDESLLGARVTKNEGYMIGSLLMPGSLVSVLYTGWLCDTVGRKRTELLCGLLYVLSWSLISTATSVSLLILGRFILGMANGMHMVACFPFLGEITQPSIRGPLASWMGCAYCMSNLVAYVTGWLCSYQVVNYLNLTLCVGFVLLVSVMKETPVYLLEKGLEKEALKSLQFYRGAAELTQEVVDELKYLRCLQGANKVPIDESSDLEKSKLEVEDEQLRQKATDKRLEEISAWKILRSSKAAQRAMVVATVQCILVVFSGPVAMTAYATQLFTLAVPSLSSHVCSVVLAVVFLAGSLLAMVVSDLVGRRTTLIASSTASAICLALVSSLLRWNWAPQWAVPGAVLTYCCVYQVGVGNVPLVQLSEMFTSKLRSISTMIAIAALCVCNFIVLAFFGLSVDTFGLDGTFLMFSLFGVITTVVTFFFSRETKGVPLEVIQQSFEQGYLYKKRKE